MAIIKEVEVSVDAKQALKTLDELGGSFEDVYGEVQPLSGRIGELEDRLYEMALAGQQNTKEFRDLTKEVGSMKKVIIDTDLVVDGMSQTMAQNVGGAIGGVASGFTLAQGAMASFGVESQAVEETLLKVQSAMAISEGLQGIRESVASFKGLGVQIAKTKVGQVALNAATKVYSAVTKGMTAVQWAFNAALNANPIGAVVIAITGLIAAGYALIKLFSFFTEDSISAAEANEQLNKSIEKQNKLFEDNANAVRKNSENRRRLLEVNGATEEELHKDTLTRLKEEEDLRKEELTNLKNRLKERRELYKQAKEEEDDDTARAIKEEIQKDKERYKELELNNKEYNLSVEEENKRFRDQEKAEQEKAAKEEEAQRRDAIAKYKDYLQNRLQVKRQIEDLELALMYDNEAKAQEANRLQFERQIEDIKSNEKIKAEEKAKLIALLEQQEFEKRKEISANYVEQLSLSTKSAEIVAEQQTADAKINIWEYASAAREKIDKDDFEARQQRREKEAKLVAAGFEFLGNLSAAFAQGNERQQKIAFNITKAANIAQATMDTYKAAQGAYASFASIPVVGVPLGIAAAAAAVAAGIANVRAIAQTKFEGGGGAGAASSPSAPTAAGGFPAQFNVVGNTGVNQLAQTLGEQPLKAYVVAGDVTSAQSLERNKIEQSTI